MEVKPVKICRVQQVPIGSLFVLFAGETGNPICLRAAYKLSEEEADEANRVVPLHWPEDQGSVGVAVYASAVNGYAVVLENARLEVNPLSACSTEIRSVSAVYGRGERFFFPISYQGRIRGLVDAQTGEILPSASGTYLAFEEWQVTVSEAALDRRVILSLDAHDRA